jgi:hypothetical protein
VRVPAKQRHQAKQIEQMSEQEHLNIFLFFFSSFSMEKAPTEIFYT